MKKEGGMAEQKPIERSFLLDGAKLCETVAYQDTRTIMYACYDPITSHCELIESLVLDGITYTPPQNPLAFTGTLLFPTYPEPYNSVSELLDEVRAFIHLYLELPEDYEFLASCYVLLTWVFDCFEAIPYLRARGEFGTGKSRFLQTLGALCYRSCFAGGSSTVSPIFRIIDLYQGVTLILDEADFRFSGPDAEMIKILNTGYMKGCPVLRTEGDRERIPTAYNTYGPKILATRKEFQDQALESRCLTNYMTPMRRTDIPIHLPRVFHKTALRIRNKLLQFRFDHYGQYDLDESLAVPGLEPRINQVLLPLFALLEDEVGGLETLQAFAKKHALVQQQTRSESLEAEILQAMVVVSKESPYLPMKVIAEKVNEHKDRDQGEFLISPTKVGRVNKTSFGFTTRMLHGRKEILWDTSLASILCTRYNISLQGDQGELGELFGEEGVKVLEDTVLGGTSKLEEEKTSPSSPYSPEEI